MHAICNMLGDGLVPSNSKAGYLVRMLARRVCRMKESLSIPASLSELGAHHIHTHLDLEGFVQTEDGILEILELEEARYHEMLRKGRAAVKTALKSTPLDSRHINDEILFRLSEERGLNPDMVVSIGKELGWPNLEVRVGFTADMAARNALMTKDASKTKDRKAVFEISEMEPTQLDFYEDTSALEFQAEVLHCFSLTKDMITGLTFSGEVKSIPSYAVVTDRTLFYPEGGGQLGIKDDFYKVAMSSRFLTLNLKME